MNDRQIRDLIRQSASEVEIPEGLKPEKIEELLGRGGSSSKKGRKVQKRLALGYTAAAAVLVLVCSLPLLNGASGRDRLLSKDKSMKVEAPDQVENAGEEKQEEVAVSEDSAPKKNAGDLYRVAEDYDQVYEAVAGEGEYFKYGYIITDDVVVAMPTERNEMVDGASNNFGAKEEVKAEPEETVGTAGDLSQKDYSTTNVQMQGVDESDIVKTDGSFLYVVTDNKIHILDIRQGEPKKTAVIRIPSGNASTEVREIYVDGENLLVITEERDAQLKKVEGKAAQYRTVTDNVTNLYTYSLEKPANPKLLGKVGQDGYYHTSRKIADKVYLFTNEMIIENCYGTAKDSLDWVPEAGGERIAADCIYLPEVGYNSLIISSVDIDSPEQILDNVMVVNNSAEVYVSTQAVYLYHNTWNQYQTTEIAKFSLQDGVIDAVAAASVRGSVLDTFAVNESGDHLRILTCNTGTGEGTNLYILDSSLSPVGELTGIAPGETVYAARYLGDMAYFVTYRNVDPLFAADLSDPENPVILGELKITGYSEYLHMWGENALFGIGFETDPDSGLREGIKLSMFDVSDPADLQTIDCVCIENADYSPAMNQYKSVLADENANLIGFVVTDYNKAQSNTYLLFEWKNGKFANLVTEPIDGKPEYYRGVYAGDYFYIVTSGGVTAYDRTDNYRKVAELNF